MTRAASMIQKKKCPPIPIKYGASGIQIRNVTNVTAWISLGTTPLAPLCGQLLPENHAHTVHYLPQECPKEKK